MSATKFLAGFIVGGAIGALAGVLLAPKSGEETRAMIADTTKDVLNRANETVKEIQNKARIGIARQALFSEWLDMFGGEANLKNLPSKELKSDEEGIVT